MKLDDINDALGTHFDSEDYDSIGGIIIECLDRLPADGEEVALPDGTLLQVQGINQNRITKVLLTLPNLEPEEENNEENPSSASVENSEKESGKES